MRYILKVTSILMLLFELWSCNSNNPDNKVGFKNLATDTIFSEFQNSKTNALNLSPIDKGVDSFTLRIWHGISIVTPKYLTILKYQDSGWILNESAYWISYSWNSGSPEKVILDSVKTRSLPIPSSISNIVHSIINFRLDTFPSQGQIPGFKNNVADGNFYEIEIATSKYYKFIRYDNPDRYKDHYNRKMTAFIDSLNKIGVWNMFHYGR